MSSPQLFEIALNQRVARDTYSLELRGDTSDLTAPGQFANLQLPNYYLRRPLSVCRWDWGHLTLLYKVVGEGTRALSQMRPAEKVSVLNGLGNGFSIPNGVCHPLVVAGGIGTAPMPALVEALTKQGMVPRVIFGFGTADEVVLVDVIERLGVPVTVTTNDGSRGQAGLVTDAMGRLNPTGEGAAWDFVYACGPTPMLRAVFRAAGTPGQYSLEERMGCGFGACMGCTTPTTSGLERVCKEGPVFNSEALAW